MRDIIKNIGLILALVIAGVSLPIGVISFLKSAETTTITNNNYYNTTIIEQYNYTISNSTTEFYSFDNIGYKITFFNETYNITKNSILMILINRNNDAIFPIMTIRVNGTIMLWSTTKDFYMTIVLIGIYSIELTLNSDSPNYDVELLIGIFW